VRIIALERVNSWCFASTFEILSEKTRLFDQVKDVAMCRVLGAFGERGDFEVGAAFESVEQTV